MSDPEDDDDFRLPPMYITPSGKMLDFPATNGVPLAGPCPLCKTETYTPGCEACDIRHGAGPRSA